MPVTKRTTIFIGNSQSDSKQCPTEEFPKEFAKRRRSNIMLNITLLILTTITVFILAMRKSPLLYWTIASTALSLILLAQLITDGSLLAGLVTLLSVMASIMLGALHYRSFRRNIVIKPIYSAIRKNFPKISETEEAALSAGTVSWDAELFSGSPDWQKLKNIPPIELTQEEQAFLDGPTEQLCKLIDDWDIRHTQHDIPASVWEFIKQQGFLGMLIAREHGGLGFSAQAQSLIIGKISSRNPDIAIVVMVPNSLGPGELVEKYGTLQQKNHYLPRLAKGDEIPCFALTGPTSGSDAATMRDIGIICKQQWDGKETLGIELSWDKRYITLAPVATVLGLAFHLYDPNHLLGTEEDIGISLALVPTDHKGVEIGRRHLPSGTAFPNGPTSGDKVFIPMSWIIGGQQQLGKGWLMLMECLSTGRAISLPATSTAAVKTTLRHSTAYATIRKQFGLSIGKMEGIEEPLARMTENAYLVEAARAMTASLVNSGEKPAVISALLKYQSTEKMRQSISDAMDIHGGKAIIDGPSNYLQSAYQAVPVGITVEGANILTRTLITFSQGALRCHPWLLKETRALQHKSRIQGIKQFEEALGGHLAYGLSNFFGALFHNLTGGWLAYAPPKQEHTAKWYRQLDRSSKSFALVTDLTVGILAGNLKRKQKISGRLADALSELYFLSAILKRFEDDGQPKEDLVFVNYCAQNCLYRFQEALRGVIDNFPVRPARILLRLTVFPLGARRIPASDHDGHKIVRAASLPGEARDRLTRHMFLSDDINDPTGILEHTMCKVIATEEMTKKIERAVRDGIISRNHTNDWFGEAVSKGVLNPNEAKQLRELETLVHKVISVDDFDVGAVTPHYASDTASPIVAA